MQKNRLTDLNDHLFTTLEMLKSGEMRPEVAKEVCNVGRTLLESAKVELKYLDMMGLSKASSPLLRSINEPQPLQLDAPAQEAQKPNAKPMGDPVITWRCSTSHCAWEGKQKEKELIRNGRDERRVCPVCKGEDFSMLVNGVVQ